MQFHLLIIKIMHLFIILFNPKIGLIIILNSLSYLFLKLIIDDLINFISILNPIALYNMLVFLFIDVAIIITL